MKTLLALLLSSVATIAAASETSTPHQPAVEHYTYASTLDIAKVISLSSIPDVCDVVPAQMTYEDHQGQRHIVEYTVMGNGCSNK